MLAVPNAKKMFLDNLFSLTFGKQIYEILMVIFKINQYHSYGNKPVT